jgi:hypothetical protein
VRRRLWFKRSAAALAVVACASLAIAAALVRTGVGFADSPCWTGVPVFKCDLSGADAGPGNSPIDVAEPPPYYPSSALTDCGTSFFDSSTSASLSSRFGAIDCFRFGSHDQWIVLGDGETDSGSAPGGAIVAIESCGGQTACVDPQAQHSFSGFTVYYPPDPGDWPLRLQTTLGDRLLYFADASCGVFTFDVQGLKWFGRSPDVIDALLSGTGSPAVVPTPSPQPGSVALTSSAPPSSGSCSPPSGE